MIRLRASTTHLGHNESVSRGQPRRGFDFSHDLRSGLSLHLGVNEGLGRYLLKNWIVSKRTAASRVIAHSTRFTTRFPQPIRASPSGSSGLSGTKNELVSNSPGARSLV